MLFHALPVTLNHDNRENWKRGKLLRKLEEREVIKKTTTTTNRTMFLTDLELVS